MKRRHIATGAVALTTAVAMTGVGATMAHAAGQSSDNVRLSNSGRSTLQHSGLQVHTLGAAPSAANLSLSIAVPLRNQALLDSLLAKGTVISPAQYKRLFGASPASLKKVSDWAKRQGLRVVSTDAAGGAVNVQAPVRTVNKAFSLRMQRVALGTHAGLAPSTDPQLPKSLGVSSVVGLSTISVRTAGPVNRDRRGMLQQKRTSMRTGVTKATGTLGGVSPNVAGKSNCSDYWGENLRVSTAGKKFANESNAICGYSPQQAVKLYNAGAAKNVKSNVGILLWCNDKTALANANTISKYYGYPTVPKYVDQSAPENPAGGCGSGIYGEQNMDVQISHYMSPGSTITYYGAADSQDASLLSMFKKAVSQHTVSTISMSWGGAEAGQTKSFKDQWNRTAAQAAVTGISLFASTGDMGDESIKKGGTKPTVAKQVSFPASSPFFTAVGGTAVGMNKAEGRAFTVGWSTSWWKQPNPSSTSGIVRAGYQQNAIGAGGGVSGDYAQPAWQKGVVTGSTTKRTLPDISADADPATGIGVSFDGQYLYAGGGTSQSSPLVAALVADSKALSGRKIGNAAPYFYKLRKTANVRDVKAVAAGTIGAVMRPDLNSNLPLEGLAQPSDSLRVKTGWDNVTGLGEPTGSFLTAFGK